ncbi:MAG: T9SS type A sorting domain-containing protein [Bacteroidales bacterium]
MKNRKLLFGLVILFLSCIGLNSVNAQTNDQWISLGPNNVSGRSRTIIFDRFNNNIMYSGGVAGGLFISVNNGKNWQEITLGDGQQNLAITAIAQDNNGVLYIGTGENNYTDNGFGINNNTIGMLGNGVYISTTINQSNKNWSNNLTSDDAKYAWVTENIKFKLLDFTKPTTPYNYGDGKAFVNKIAVNRSSNKVYVATNDGLMQLNDSTSWTAVSAIGSANVGDIVANKESTLAVYFTDSEAKVAISSDDFANFQVILKADTLKKLDTSTLSINRIRLAFGSKNPNKLYSYVNYFSEGVEEGTRYYREMLVRTNDINSVNWRRTTAQTYYNAGVPTSMSIAVNDLKTPEEVYLGGDYVMKGYDANNSDIYYWENISRYSNSPNSTNGIRTSPEYVSSGINEIIIKENPITFFDSILIVAATDGGIHTYSFDSVLYTTDWKLSTKNMITTQFLSVAVAPDGSVVGGTEANGSVYIENSGNLGENQSGDVIWTINSPGYNPNSFQRTTNGGNVGTSQFQRILPTPRKSLIVSRKFGQIARTYGNNGDYSSIDDVTWNYSSTLFPTGIIENQTWRPYEPAVTPMYLWESTTAQLPDSMFLVINQNTAINCVRDTNSEWRTGSWIKPGDSVLAKSPTMEYPFIHTFTDSIQYNQDTAIKISNPIQSRLFFGTSQGIYVCSNIHDYIASPLDGALTPISMVKFYDTKKFANAPTEEIHCFGITNDGKTLFVSTDSVGAGSSTSFLYRFDISNTDFQNSSSAISIVPEVMVFPRKITSISVDKKNGNNVILTFGSYLSSKSNIQVSENALAQPFTSSIFKETINLDPINDQDFLPNNKPVFCALIETVKSSDTANVAYIGAEDGIYKTTNYLGTSAAGGKINVEWEKMEGIPNVPIFQLTQQTMRLPRYEFPNYVGQNAFSTSFARTELPGAIYAASYGKGLFAYIGDTIGPDERVIGIKENINKINQSTDLRVYPNPASSTTTLEYNLNQATNVTLQVYDMSGRLVSTLDKGRQSQGKHSLQMNVQNLNSGIYMVRIITNYSTNTSKLIVR